MNNLIEASLSSKHEMHVSSLKDKTKAFFAHLAISAIIACLAMVAVFYIWYPAPLHNAVGVTQIFFILLAVDVTIGPLITFIVYKKGKKTLKFDLTVVALLQISALLYGINTVFEGRPAFVVYNVDRFNVTRAYEIDPDSAQTALKNHNQNGQISWLKPKWVGALAAKENKRRNEILISSVMGGADWPQLPELFVPLVEVKKGMHDRAKPLTELRKIHEKETEILQELANWKDNEVKWFPLRSNAKDMVVLVDAKTVEIVKVLDIKPWP